MDEELEGLVVEPWELDVAEVLEEVVEVTVKWQSHYWYYLKTKGEQLVVLKGPDKQLKQ